MQLSVRKDCYFYFVGVTHHGISKSVRVSAVPAQTLLYIKNTQYFLVLGLGTIDLFFVLEKVFPVFVVIS